MKVYILMEYDIESYSEIIGVFDTLEKAQSYVGSKVKNWSTDHNNKYWWDSLGKVHLSIVELEVK